jgi:hypothetical protein
MPNRRLDEFLDDDRLMKMRASVAAKEICPQVSFSLALFREWWV